MGCGNEAFIANSIGPDGSLIQEEIRGDPKCKSCQGKGYITSLNKECLCAKRYPHNTIFQNGLNRNYSTYPYTNIKYIS